MTLRRAISLTARRELRERLRSRAFRVGLLIQLLLVLGIAVVSALTSDDGPKTVTLGVTGPEARAIGASAQDRSAAFALDLELKQLPSPAAARMAVRDGDVDLAVIRGRLFVPADPDDQAVALVRSAADTLGTTERLRAQGLSAAEIQRALNPPRSRPARRPPATRAARAWRSWACCCSTSRSSRSATSSPSA